MPRRLLGTGLQRAHWRHSGRGGQQIASAAMISNVQSHVYWTGIEYVLRITGAWRVCCAEGFGDFGVTLTARL